MLFWALAYSELFLISATQPNHPHSGYISVMNRSQKDIQENVAIRQGLAKEQAFFQSHDRYKTLLSKCGTANLARTLNQILMHHIRDCLPDIKAKIAGA